MINNKKKFLILQFPNLIYCYFFFLIDEILFICVKYKCMKKIKSFGNIKIEFHLFFKNLSDDLSVNMFLIFHHKIQCIHFISLNI